MKTRSPKLGVHKPSGRARVVVKGKTIFLGKAGSPEAQAAYHRLCLELQEAAAAAARNEPAQPIVAPPAAPPPLTVSEAALRYVAWAESYYRKGDRTTGEVHCLRRPVRVLRETFCTLPARDFTVMHLKQLREILIKSPVREEKPPKEGEAEKPEPKKPEKPAVPIPLLSRKTVNDHVDRIRRMFRWFAEESIVPGSVYRDLQVLTPLKRWRSAARETERVMPVAWKLVEATLEHLPRQVRALVEFLWWTGARVNEACSMRHADIDRSGTTWKYRVREEANKTAHHGQERVVIIGPKAQEILVPFLDRVPRPDGEAFVFSAAEAVLELNLARSAERKLPLWPSHDPAHRRALRHQRQGRKRRVGARYTPTAVRHAVQRACVAAKVDLWSPGQLRHSCATRLEQELGDLQAVGTVLGHRDPRTTAIYAERDLQRAADIMSRLG